MKKDWFWSIIDIKTKSPVIIWIYDFIKIRAIFGTKKEALECMAARFTDEQISHLKVVKVHIYGEEANK